MRPIESTSGKAHTTDEDYAKFGGQLVMTVSTTKYDPERKCWIKRTVEYIDIGRADPVVPSESASEPPPKNYNFEFQTHTNYEAAAVVNKAAGEARRAEKANRICNYIKTHGPSPVNAIADALEMPRISAFQLMQRFEGEKFHRVKRIYSSHTVIWGLVGVHDKEAA